MGVFSILSTLQSVMISPLLEPPSGDRGEQEGRGAVWLLEELSPISMLECSFWHSFRLPHSVILKQKTMKNTKCFFLIFDSFA